MTVAALCIMALAAGAHGEDKPQPAAIALTLKTVDGAEVKVPNAECPTVLLFVRADHQPSAQALDQAKMLLKDPKAAQAIVILSGESAPAGAKALAADGKYPWPIVVDGEFALSGQLSVYAWPTTLVIRADGRQVAHLPGVSKSFTQDLEAYLAFASNQIDQAGLEHRLNDHDVVADTDQKIANRHIAVAHRLLDKGMPEQARLELEQGIKHEPNDPELKLAMADVLLVLGQPADALKQIEEIGEKLPAVQLNLARARALVAMKKLDEAKPLLLEIVKLNPDPAEAYYTLGLLYQQQNDAQKSAAAFQAAFEATREGRNLRPTTREK